MVNTRESLWAAALSAGLLVSLSSMGCSLDGLLHSDELPKDVSDPAITQTPNGAQAAYRGTVAQFRTAFGASTHTSPSFVLVSGMLSDELLDVADIDKSVDQRLLLEGRDDGTTPQTYSALQKVRGQATQAIGLLTQYVPDQPMLAGHLYALQGYAELFLAELFCSGIPLSTLDYHGDYTYRSGSTTDEVLAHAAALFDTALTLAGDSARVADLARVGRARALLGRGDYVGAAMAVASVADAYKYNVSYNNVQTGTEGAINFAGTYDFNVTGGTPSIRAWGVTVPNREGVNGLDWRASSDPRTQVEVDSTPIDGTTYRYIYHPAKYSVDGSSPIVLASGIEARLIEAEAALQAHDAAAWLAKLNYLRQTAWPTIVPATSTALPDLVDPGSDTARVTLLFRERAFWLFLTGHRQGDLRRLIRQYGRSQHEIYPVGGYPGSLLSYGSSVTVPVPVAERATNPLYTGCTSRDE